MSGFARSVVARKAVRPRASFAGARSDRLTLDWVTQYVSANQEIRTDLLTLRHRARELVQNVSWARRYTQHVANNVVGPKGIRLQARMENREGLPLQQANDRLEEAWGLWGRAGTATVDGRLSFADVQQLVMGSCPTDGECLIRLVPGFDNEFGFALQLLDPDQLDETKDQPRAPGRPEIRMGVQMDDWGRPTFYHLWQGHPSEPGGRQPVIVPAEQMIHLFRPSRINQARGVTWLASVMLDLNMLRGYFEAELVAARVAAAKGGFFTRDANSDDPGPSIEASNEKLSMDAEPGLFEELPAGMGFEPWAPQHPSTAFPEFTKALLRSIASGLGISYSALAADLTDVNYSSIRAGILDERDVYRTLQEWITEHLHRRVYGLWVRQALLNGQVDARVALSQYQLVDWVPRGWAWVDPESDVNAARTAIGYGLNSRTRILAEQGLDYEEILRDIAREEKLAKKLGVTLGDVPEQIETTTSDTTGSKRLEQDREDAEAFARGFRRNGHPNGNGKVLHG